MASRLGYASASGHGCRGRGTNIAVGTTNGGNSICSVVVEMIENTTLKDASPSLSAASVGTLLHRQAQQTPQATAIIAPYRSPLTYGGLYEQAARVVSTLNVMGLGRNDRIAMLLPNGPDLAVAFLAVAAGATCAPLNPAYREAELDFYLSNLNARALIVESGDDSPAIRVARAQQIPLIELVSQPDGVAGVFALEGDTGLRPVQGGLAQPDDVALVLHTSGTTSRPKLVPLTHANICTSARNVQCALQLSREDRCLNIMPLFHIHGLIAAVLASLTAGASTVCTPGFYAPKFLEWLSEFRPTWYTAVPTMHQAIVARAETNRNIIAHSPLRFIRSCSSAMPPLLMAQLENAFGAPLIEAYGMTEAAHQISSNPLPPAERKPGSVGVAADPEVSVMDKIGNLLPAGEMGEIVIRGPNVTCGYENNPGANEAAFTNGWFRTGDEGYLDEEGYLFIRGRIKEIINRGGEKISPREVDEVLLHHPAVAQAVTFALPDDRLGEDVATALVLHDGTTVTQLEIQEFAAKQLADFKVPRTVVIVDEIPKGPTGKLQRVGLAEKLGLDKPRQKQEGSKPEFIAPHTPTEGLLADIWAQVLDIEGVSINDEFLALGGDSVLAAQVISRVREALQVELPLIYFFEASTIGDLAVRIDDFLARQGQDA